MKLWLKILLGVAAGFGGGFAAGFLTHKKLNDIQFEEVTEEEFDKMLNEVPEKVKKAAEEKQQKMLEAAVESKPDKELPTDPDKLRNALQGKTPYIQMDDEKKKEYSKIWNTVKDYSSEENADELPLEDGIDPDFLDSLDEELKATDERDEPPPKTKPYQISLGEFYEERREYDKITIDWYDEDDVVLDEREEIIPDPKSYVGMSMKELFDMPSQDGDPDAVFVRNDQYGTDYEVIRHHASYRKAVQGEE